MSLATQCPKSSMGTEMQVFSVPEGNTKATPQAFVSEEQSPSSAIIGSSFDRSSLPNDNMTKLKVEETSNKESSEDSSKHSQVCFECHPQDVCRESYRNQDHVHNQLPSENMSCFPGFAKFPLEIQCMIWDFSMEEDRIIEVHLTKRCKRWSIFYASTDAKNPAILSVCKIARARGLKHYKALSVANSWKREKQMYDMRRQLLGLPSNFDGPEAATTNFKCYINYYRDTIYINTNHCRIYGDTLEIGNDTWREAFGYQFLKDLFYSSAGQEIQKLAVDYPVAEKWFSNGGDNWKYCRVLASMPQLQKLAIVWTGHHNFPHVFKNECCRLDCYELLPGEVLTNEERYGIKLPSKTVHHRVLKLHKIAGFASYLGEGWISDRFASGQTSAAWKRNIMTAIQENRPTDPARYPPNTFHFLADGRSRYRDLDDLEFTEVAAEREG